MGVVGQGGENGFHGRVALDFEGWMVFEPNGECVPHCGARRSVERSWSLALAGMYGSSSLSTEDAFQDPPGCLTLWIVLNSIYTMLFPIHTYLC